MKIKNILLMSLLSSFGIAHADYISLENPDNLQIKLQSGNDIIPNYSSNNYSQYYSFEPSGNDININYGGKTLNLISSRGSKSAFLGCNYTLLITKNNGYIVKSSNPAKEGCSPSINDISIPGDGIVYILSVKSNESNSIVYPAFKGDGIGSFASDSEFGYLRNNTSVLYTSNNTFIKSIHQSLKSITPGFYDARRVKYIECDISSIRGKKGIYNLTYNGQSCNVQPIQ